MMPALGMRLEQKLTQQGLDVETTGFARPSGPGQTKPDHRSGRTANQNFGICSTSKPN